MRKIYLLTVCLVVTASVHSQHTRKTFIITSTQNNPAAYTRISALDVQSGKQVADLYDVQKSFRYRSGQSRPYTPGTAKGQSPMAGAVACMAFDAKTNRLYYIPQQLSELRYMDLSQQQPSFTAFESQSLNLLHNREDVANQVSRMAMGADGFGYALTNDGEHLIKFSTGDMPVIQDLGVLVDNPSNQVMVRSSCTSWGGDIVGAADGSLYLVSVHNHVFRINMPSKRADYIGQIKQLPQEFTSNGASADEDGNLLVSCGASIGKNFSPVYKVNMKTLEAAPATVPDGVGNIADMASSNLLFASASSAAMGNTVSFQAPVTKDELLPQVSIFPNPVSRGRFQLKASNMTEKGDYRMSLVDAGGNVVMEAKMDLSPKTSTHSFTLPSGRARGVYFVRVADFFGRTVFSQQLIVE